MFARKHWYMDNEARAEVTASDDGYRVSVVGPHHPHGLLPIIIENEAEAAKEHAERLMLELYPHTCHSTSCDEWAPEGV
jgi:hypothetical protein